MFASVVIPTYERPAKLEQTLESVCDQTVDEYEVLVVDDGSTGDEQAAVLERFETRERFTVLRQPNAGPAAARNRGWQAADGDVILFTDDDCLVPTNWVESLTTGFEYNVAGVGGSLVPREDLIESNVFARAHRFRDMMNYDWPDEPVIGHDGLNVGGTANVAYRREVMAELDGFDESFPLAAGEDADFQRRVISAGYKMKFVPIPVRHNDDYDLRSFIRRAVRSGRGTNHYHEKHGEPRSPVRVLAGLIGSALYIGPALVQSRDVGVATLYVVERALNRWGELRSVLAA